MRHFFKFFSRILSAVSLRKHTHTHTQNTSVLINGIIMFFVFNVYFFINLSVNAQNANLGYTNGSINNSMLPMPPGDCLGQELDCNLICNPTLQSDCLSGFNVFFNEDCFGLLNYPGWGTNLVSTPDYFQNLNPPFDEVLFEYSEFPVNPGGIGLFAGVNNTSFQEDCWSESITTALNLTAGSTYLLSYTRKAESNSFFSQPLLNIYASPMSPSGLGVTDPTSTTACGVGALSPTDQLIISDTDFLNSDGDLISKWNNILTCFTPTTNIQSLYVIADIPTGIFSGTPNSFSSYTIIDNMDLVEIPSLPSFPLEIGCGEPIIYEGLSCLDALSGTNFNWEMSNNPNGPFIPLVGQVGTILNYTNGVTTLTYFRLSITSQNNNFQISNLCPLIIGYSPDCPAKQYCLENQEFDYDAYNNEYIVIEDNEIWTQGSSNINYLIQPKINTTITVKNGAQLTLQNITCKMGFLTEIVVEKGGTLILDNTILESSGPCMWPGIRVQGEGPFLTGQNNEFGVMDLINNSIIRDAIIGSANTLTPTINYLDMDVFSIPDLTDNAFQNNETWLDILGVVSLPSITNAGGKLNLQSGSYQNCFVGVLNSYDLLSSNTIEDIKFSGINHLKYPLTQLGSETGVSSFLYNDLTIGTDCEFTNLRYGNRVNALNSFIDDGALYSNCRVGTSIFHFNDSPGNIADISQATYNDCFIGLQAQSCDLTMAQCTTNVSNSSTTNIGAFIAGSDIDANLNVYNSTDIGILVQSNASSNSNIKNSIFNSNTIGCLLSGTNTGLQLWCNTFNENTAPWFFANNGNDPSALDDQGFCDLSEPGSSDPTTNTFVDLQVPIVPLDFLGWGANPNFTYYHGDVDLIPVNQIPIELSPAISVEECINQFDIDVCGRKSYSKPEIISLADGFTKDRLISQEIKKDFKSNNTSTGIEFLRSINTKSANRELTQIYTRDKNSSLVQETLVLLPENVDEDKYFKDYYSILKKANGLDNWIYGLLEEDVSIIIEIASGNTQTSYRARSLMQLLRGIEYRVDFPVLPDEYGIREDLWGTYFKGDQDDTSLTSLSFLIYPIPSNDYIHIVGKSTIADPMTKISLYGLTGKLVIQSYLCDGIIDLSTIADGTYILKIWNDAMPLGEFHRIIKQ